ncbi:MAG: hypothetical protein QW166_02925 [Candidatus Bathyarchaeia archaeon]
MSKYRIDLITAYELAEKALERVEKRTKPKPQPVDPPDPYDYTQPCQPNTNQTMNCPDAGMPCFANSDCAEGTPGTCSCPAPKPNSSLVGNNCSAVIVTSCQNCPPATRKCASTGVWICQNYCYYACNPGYVWNGTDCVPVGVMKFYQKGTTTIYLSG